MYLTEETIRAVLVAAIQAHGTSAEIDQLIKTTVGALIAADRKLADSLPQEI
ncbi:hypothetical protein MID00_19890 [Alcaligenes sp. NLF5-7]|jgi:hypothetical protein|uniref:hypothetical protein n=1 Tax=Alcaligenes sp. NLF5-7 TaxID=2918755 RepID=UPI0020C3B0B0|nr:hypothetical protein [Alcaligenes sp. NLF5-7]UTM01717.1 hypothetical protein MID00_19890 [Alcaligenes sp. NLF5-7]